MARDPDGIEERDADDRSCTGDDTNVFNLPTFQSNAAFAPVQLPTHPRAVYQSFVRQLEEAVHSTSLESAEHFHGFLWMAIQLCPKDNAQVVQVMDLWQIAFEEDVTDVTEPIDLSEVSEETVAEIRRSLLNKISSWINCKTTPTSLVTRQRVMAAALHALRLSIFDRSAIPMRTINKMSSVKRDCPPEYIQGLGAVRKPYDDAVEYAKRMV